jgi:hypothetical protein
MIKERRRRMESRIEVWIHFVDRHYSRARFFHFGKLARRVADWWLGPCGPDQEHPTIFVESLNANIDVQVAPLVEKLNNLGFETSCSCQGSPGVLLQGPGQGGFVMFTHEDNEFLAKFVLETLGDLLAPLIPTSVGLTVERGRSLYLAEMWFTNEVLDEVTERLKFCNVLE